MQEINFISFADTKYTKTLMRIKTEAENTGLFKNIFAWNENDLDEDFIKNHGGFINNNPRGYGFYIWKPQVILQALNKTSKNSILVYADAGCTINKEGNNRMLEYISETMNHPKGILSFELEDFCLEKKFTKMDTLTLFGFNNEEHLNKNQVCATTMILHNTDSVKEFVKEWINICIRDNYRYIDNNPSYLPNTSHFIEHRWDQSIFSMLIKKYNCLSIPDETFWEHNGIPKWDLNKHFPIHATRLRF